MILPDGKAFFAGTYFPKPQLLDILSQIQTLWKNEKDSVINQANQIDNILNKVETKTQGDIDKSIIPKAIQALLSNFDEMEGGFWRSAKIPT